MAKARQRGMLLLLLSESIMSATASGETQTLKFRCLEYSLAVPACLTLVI